jgi:hypothetical protein
LPETFLEERLLRLLDWRPTGSREEAG